LTKTRDGAKVFTTRWNRQYEQ